MRKYLLNKIICPVLLMSLTVCLLSGAVGCGRNQADAGNEEASGMTDATIEVIREDDFWELSSSEDNDPNADIVNDDETETAFEDTDEAESTEDDAASEGRISEATGEKRAYNSKRRVICYGDSMVEGTGGNGVTMPNTLERLSGAEVLNYGVYAENTSCISARMGANPQYLNDDIVIPADSTPVNAQVSGKYGWEKLLNFGNAGINNVFIDGIEGKYFITEDGQRMFSRITPGEEKYVKAGTQLITHAMLDKRPNDIIVLWCGSNDEPQNSDDINGIIARMKEMLSYLGTTQYIIISETTFMDRFPVINELNQAYAREFGSHYLDLRGYLIDNALSDLGIEPTAADIEAIARGDIPNSIRVDDSHGNSDYYTLAGEQVYRKMTELGYLK